MPRIKWKKTELVEGLQPTFGTLVCDTHGPVEVLCHERVSAVKAWEDLLTREERCLLPCLRGERTQEQVGVELGMRKRTVQRRVRALREYARRALAAVRP